MGLLDGLSNMGLGKLAGADIYEEEKKPEAKKVEEVKEDAEKTVAIIQEEAAEAAEEVAEAAEEIKEAAEEKAEQ